jgi:hypothetical protein
MQKFGDPGIALRGRCSVIAATEEDRAPLPCLPFALGGDFALGQVLFQGFEHRNLPR